MNQPDQRTDDDQVGGLRMNQPDQRTDDDPALTALHQAGNLLTRARERFTTAAAHLSGARATRAAQLAEVATNLEASAARLIRGVDQDQG